MRRGRTPTQPQPPSFSASKIPGPRTEASFQAGVALSQSGCLLSSSWQKGLFVVVHTEAILQCRGNGRPPVHPVPSIPLHDPLCRSERSRTFCLCILQFCLRNPGFMSPPNNPGNHRVWWRAVNSIRTLSDPSSLSRSTLIPVTPGSQSHFPSLGFPQALPSLRRRFSVHFMHLES